MNFSIEKSISLLSKTPTTLSTLLHNLDEDWIYTREREDSWNAFDIVGHLIHGEITDWIPRARIILSNANDKSFPPFDRFAQEKASEGKTLQQLLEEFEALRKTNLETLKAWQLNEEQLALTGVHPEFGEVTLKALIATWAAHDFVHLNQMTRVMARHYKEDVGPWKNYLSILNY